MKKLLASIFLKLIGWKIDLEVRPELKRSVMVASPHTSNWDFPIALAAFWKYGLSIRFFIKDTYTRGISGWLFRWAGALGVDRSKANRLTDYAIELFEENRELIILVPAEGSRKRAEKWRTGFYRIAMQAGVPIAMGYLDYKRKQGGVLGLFYPSGDFEKDMFYIQEKYRHVKGKYPENYNPEIF